MFKHVLIPTDGSKVARKAIKAGIALAKPLGARVTAYYALDTASLYPYVDGHTIDLATLRQFENQAREQGAKYLAEVEKAAKAAGVACRSLITDPATPYQGIIAAAKKQKCDVIFMAS